MTVSTQFSARVPPSRAAVMRHSASTRGDQRGVNSPASAVPSTIPRVSQG